MRVFALVAILLVAAGCRKEPGEPEQQDPPPRGDDAGEESMDSTGNARDVVERWMQAGEAADAEAVWSAVDWGATGAAKMTRSMHVLAEVGGDVAGAARSGVSELAAAEENRDLVANRIADILATLNERPTSLRRIEGAERDELLGRLRAEPPEGLPAEVLAELEPRLARARDASEVFVIESAAGSALQVGVTPRGRLVLIPTH